MNATHTINGKCPEDKQPCSTVTTGMNTVCVEPSKIEKDCPIIDIKFLTDVQGYENYTKIPYSDVILAYTYD